MPSNRDFIVSILVGGVELPEYEKNGEYFVESNLFTPVSYTQQCEELVQGEIEKQGWPVTPYQIRVTAKPNTPYSYYKIFVDGQKASQIAVKPGKNCVSEGFYDGVNITEFLFSLPRLPQNKKDRLDKGKITKVGRIEVECWNSKVTGYKKPILNKLDYSQANKKDSTQVTNGEYVMATTKVGRSVRTTQKSVVEDWTLFNVRSRIAIRYAMGHSLIDMGFILRPIRIPIHRIPASVVRGKMPAPNNKRKRLTQTARKSTTPSVLDIELPDLSTLPVIEMDTDVIEIDSDEDVVVGELIPSKKQKSEDGDDGEKPSTSKDADDAEKNGDDKKNGDDEKDEEAKTEEKESEKIHNEKKGEEESEKDNLVEKNNSTDKNDDSNGQKENDIESKDEVKETETSNQIDDSEIKIEMDIDEIIESVSKESDKEQDKNENSGKNATAENEFRSENDGNTNERETEGGEEINKDSENDSGSSKETEEVETEKEANAKDGEENDATNENASSENVGQENVGQSESSEKVQDESEDNNMETNKTDNNVEKETDKPEETADASDILAAIESVNSNVEKECEKNEGDEEHSDNSNMNEAPEGGDKSQDGDTVVTEKGSEDIQISESTEEKEGGEKKDEEDMESAMDSLLDDDLPVAPDIALGDDLILE